MRVNPVNDKKNDSRNVTSDECYKMPTTVRKLESPEKTTKSTSRPSIPSKYRSGDPDRIFQPGMHDRNANITRSSTFSRVQDDVFPSAFKYANKTLPACQENHSGNNIAKQKSDVDETTKTSEKTRQDLTSSEGRSTLLYAGGQRKGSSPSEENTIESFTESSRSERNDTTVDAIRVKNMMAIVRFMMKLLRIIAEDAERPPCPAKTQIKNAMIQVKNVLVNGVCREDHRDNAAKQKSNADETMLASERTRQNLTSTEWRSTIAEKSREGSSSSEGDTPESFTEAPSPRPTMSTPPSPRDEALKNDGLSRLFETSTRREIHAPTLPNGTSSSSTTGSFLFYESGRKSPCEKEDAPRKNTDVALTELRKDSRLPVNKSEVNSRGRESRSDDSQTSRRCSLSRPRSRDQSVVDRLQSKQEIVFSVATPNEDNVKTTSGSFKEKYPAGRRRRGFRRSKSKGDGNNDIIGSTLLQRSKKSTKKVRSAVSNRVCTTRTKLLNSSTRGGAWTGEQRAYARQLPLEKKLQESRTAPVAPTPEKLVFRRVRGNINRPYDPNIGRADAGDSFVFGGRAIGSNGAVKLAIDDALDTIQRSPREKRISQKIVNKHMRFVTEKTR